METLNLTILILILTSLFSCIVILIILWLFYVSRKNNQNKVNYSYYKHLEAPIYDDYYTPPPLTRTATVLHPHHSSTRASLSGSVDIKRHRQPEEDVQIYKDLSPSLIVRSSQTSGNSNGPRLLGGNPRYATSKHHYHWTATKSSSPLPTADDIDTLKRNNA